MTTAVSMQQVILPPGIPDNVVPVVAIVFGTVMIMVIVTPIIRAIIRAVERRHQSAPAAALPADLGARLDRIEQTVDSIDIEIERVFDIDGMGLLFYNSIVGRDYNVVLGLIVLISLFTILGRLFSDVLYALVDPRIRFD